MKQIPSSPSSRPPSGQLRDDGTLQTLLDSMVAAKKPSLSDIYLRLCAKLREDSKVTVHVTNHIAAKHGIHTLPAFHNSDAVSDEDKYATYTEIVHAIHKKDYTRLRGQVAQGQAEATERATQPTRPLATRDAVLPPQPQERVKPSAPPDPLAELKAAGEAALRKLAAGFIGGPQLAAVKSGMKGEEREFFYGKMVELAAIVDKMPHTYQADDKPARAKADDLPVHLHYFTGGCDWFILEKDKGDPEDKENGVPPQSQAYGWACLGGDLASAELGYISLPEISAAGAELDFHWEQVPLKDAIAAIEERLGVPTKAESAPAPAVPPAPPPQPAPAAAEPSLMEELRAITEKRDRVKAGLASAGIAHDVSDRLALDAVQIGKMCHPLASEAMGIMARDLLYNAPTGILPLDECTPLRAVRLALAQFAARTFNTEEIYALCAEMLEEKNHHEEAKILRRLAHK